MANGQVELKMIGTREIDASPYQVRKHFDERALAELSQSIRRDGLIEPIVVRRMEDRYELIAGERRLRATKIAGGEKILSRIVEATNLQARRMAAAENVQRVDLSFIEWVDAVVEIVDAELIDDEQYRDFGANSIGRVQKLLGILAGVANHDRENSKRESQGRDDLIVISNDRRDRVNKFINTVQRVFENLPKSMDWQSFYVNDLPLITSIEEDIIEVAIQQKLNKSQTKALADVKKASPETFTRLVTEGASPIEDLHDFSFPIHEEPPLIPLQEISAAELKRIARREDQSHTKVIEKLFDPPPIPEGKHNVIMADPPWRYDFSETEPRAIESHYPTMSIEELCQKREEILDRCTDDAVLFLWATTPKLKEALQVMDAWGFVYKTSAVWDKELLGMGYWFRGEHELLLVGTRGNMPPPEPSVRHSSILRETRIGHSQKPIEAYELIEKMFPYAKWLELFARTVRKGWNGWGNQYEA